MRKTVPMSVGDLWKDYLGQNPTAQRGLSAARVATLWPAIAGPAVASYTRKVWIDKGVLYVQVDSSAARQELFMRREALADAVNRALGAAFVRSVEIR